MKRILVTRPRAQADSFGDGLRAAGFDPIYFPVIEICPIENNVALDKAFNQLHCYAWMVFTSVNAVDVVFGLVGATHPGLSSPIDNHGQDPPTHLTAHSPHSHLQAA